MCRRRREDLRAGSGEEESGSAAAKAESGDEAAATSRPDVKARDPAPERTIHRMDGSEERWEKRGGRANHMEGMKALSLAGREISTSGIEGLIREAVDVGSIEILEGREDVRAMYS